MGSSDGLPAALTSLPGIRVLITGFGKFSGVDENPTQSLLEWLQSEVQSGCTLPLAQLAQLHGRAQCEGREQQQQQQQQQESTASLQQLQNARQAASGFVHIHSLAILKVSAQEVDTWLSSSLCSSTPGAESSTAPLLQGAHSTSSAAQESAVAAAGSGSAVAPPQTVLLHLGVDARASTFRLESRAFNNASFRVPDESGWQPQAEPIDPGLDGGVNHCLLTDVDLPTLQQRLSSRGHAVAISDNAGRFVCNYTFLRSLVATADRPSWHAMFVHVPTFATIPEHKQRHFLVDLLQELALLPPSA